MTKPIEEYWAEIDTYNPLNINRQPHLLVLFRLWLDSNQCPPEHKNRLIEYFYKSYAQTYQDLIVLTLLNWKTNGFFVEFGATDGKSISNTYLLEKEFNWDGILAEPAKIWHNELFKNRTCHIDVNCVHGESNQQVMFHESLSRPDASLITDYITEDMYKVFLNNNYKKVYPVNTINLNDLLTKYNAPKSIDYISLDTEGNEYTILENFNFSNYEIKFISVEHNYKDNNRLIINKLLTSKGYKKILENISQQDDFYVLKEYNIFNELR